MTTKEQILESLRANKIILARFGVKEVGLFGSYIRNESTSISDIDLLIDFELNKHTFENFMSAYDFLEQLFSNEKVEVITKSSLSPHIGPHILKEVQYV